MEYVEDHYLSFTGIIPIESLHENSIDTLIDKIKARKSSNLTWEAWKSSFAEYIDLDEIGAQLIIKSNKRIEIAVLKDLAKHADPCLRRSIALFENTPDSILEELANDEDALVRNSVLERNLDGHWKPSRLENLNYEELTITSDQETLRIFSSSGDTWTRAAVAENKNTPVDILCKLSFDADPWVRKEVIANKNTPLAIKQRLRSDLFENVRQGEQA